MHAAHPSDPLAALELDAILVEDPELDALRAHLGAAHLPPEQRVGVPSMDEEQAACNAALERAIARAADGDAGALGEALARARHLFAAHFRSEEDLMIACGFPDASGHAFAHDRFLKALDGCLERLGREGLTGGVVGWLSETAPQWVETHLANDSAVGGHIDATGWDVGAAEIPWRKGLPEVGTAPLAGPLPAARGEGELFAHAPPAEPSPSPRPSPPLRGGEGVRFSLSEREPTYAAAAASIAAGDVERALELLRGLFADEERAMAETGYPGGTPHAVAHELIVAGLRLLARDPRDAATQPLARWFAEHHGATDAALSQHLERVRAAARTVH